MRQLVHPTGREIRLRRHLLRHFLSMLMLQAIIFEGFYLIKDLVLDCVLRVERLRFDVCFQITEPLESLRD